MSKQITHKEFFEAEISMGLTPDNEAYKNLHYQFGERIIKRFAPKTVLEVGPGVGTFLEYMLKNGVDAVGIDPNPYEKQFFDTRNPDLSEHYKTMALGDIKLLLANPIDILVSIEVIEHITDKEILSVIEMLSRKCKHFIFSSTPEHTDWDLAWGHINVKETEAWIEFFAPWFDFVENMDFPTRWTLLFKSKFYENE